MEKKTEEQPLDLSSASSFTEASLKSCLTPTSSSSKNPERAVRFLEGNLLVQECESRSIPKSKQETVEKNVKIKADRKKKFGQNIIKISNPHPHFKCAECGFITTYKNIAKDHMCTDDEAATGTPSFEKKKLFVCEVCTKEYNSENSRRRHIRSVHSKLDISCNKCEKIFKRKDSLKKHMDKKHLKEAHENPFYIGHEEKSNSTQGKLLNSPAQYQTSVIFKFEDRKVKIKAPAKRVMSKLLVDFSKYMRLELEELREVVKTKTHSLVNQQTLPYPL